MDLEDARNLALDEMADHRLYGWTFAFDRAVRRFGLCNYQIKQISLSEKLVRLNSEDEVLDTIRHEIAHALVGSAAGHGPEWQRVARSIGCNGKRLHNAVTPPSRYTGVCINCHRTIQRNRKPSRGRTLACVVCCNRYNGGKYSADYRIQFIDNKTLSGVR